MHIVLRTPRLALRQFTEDDVENLFNLNSDPEVMRYLGRPASREVLRDKIIPFFLGAYQRFDRLGTWAAESADRASSWAGSTSAPSGRRHHQH